MTSSTVFTIGHSRHSLERFCQLLEEAGIEAVADVRSAPYSRLSPHFNREALQQWLNQYGLYYVFLGRELGGRGSDDTSRTSEGRVRYDALGSSPEFRAGIRRVLRGASSLRIALMCAESDPLNCHRGLLVSRRLVEMETEVMHVLPTGDIESHAEAERRLIELAGLKHPDLFGDEATLLALAYAKQESKVAYSPQGGHKVAKGTTT